MSRDLLRFGGLLTLLLATLGAALSIGTTSIDPAILFADPHGVLAIRLPRVVTGALAGAGLAAAGVAFQAMLRNPLADPYIVGVSGGAALGGVLALVVGMASPWGLPLAAFAGAVISVLLLFGLAHARGRSDPLTLLLIGVVFNAFAAAVVTFLKTVVSATKAQEILFWLMGTIEVLPGTLIAAHATYVAFGVAALWLGAGALNLLATTDDEARSLGLSVEHARLWLFLAAALVVGAVVATCGMIGFVGLVVPHVLRRLLGADHRLLLPASLCGGAIFLVIADALARLCFLFFATELPVGVVTAATGGPFFLALLLRRES